MEIFKFKDFYWLYPKAGKTVDEVKAISQKDVLGMLDGLY